MIPEQLWRVRSSKRTDDDNTNVCKHIDCIYVSLDEALAEVDRRCQDPVNLAVTVSREPMTERYRTMYAAAEVHETNGGANG